MTDKKFLLKIAGINQAGGTVEESCSVEGEQDEINEVAWKITERWIKEGVRDIHVVGVFRQIDQAPDPCRN